MKLTLLRVLLVSLAILPACNSNLSVSGGQLLKPKVETLDRAAAKPGDQVSFSGTNLTEDMDVLIGDQVIAIKILGNNIGSFKLPDSLPSGVLNVSFRQKGTVLHTMPLINESTLTNLPLTTADPNQVCDDILFTKPDGTVQRGTRICKADLCTRDGQSNCLANEDFPTISLAATATAGNIRAGVVIAGVTGTHPSYSNCSSDGQQNCITGTRYKAMDTDPSVISTWDIRRGKQAGGITGKIEFITNRIDNLAWDRAPVGPDVYDNVDDFADARAFPTTAAPGFPSYNGNVFIRDPGSDTGAGTLAGNGICDAGEDCVYLDQMTGLRFSPLGPILTFDNAVAYCDALVYGGYSDWRLPMQKELYQAYINGFASISDALGSNRFVRVAIWTGTTVSGSGSHHLAYAFATFAGFVGQYTKANLETFHCTR